MPVSAPKKCVHVGCSALVKSGSRCPLHQKEKWKKKVTATKRITGRRLQQLREQLFKRNPLCAICKIRAATIRDHIKSLFDGGEDIESNTQGLCSFCDDIKSKSESSRARGGAG
jgi:5-methylcytosine-specific restriction protein A